MFNYLIVMGSPWKALGDDSRRKILLLLNKRDLTPSQIAKHFDFTFPAISTHLRVLREADLVIEKRDGKNRFYSLNKKRVLEMIKFFQNLR